MKMGGLLDHDAGQEIEVGQIGQKTAQQDEFPVGAVAVALMETPNRIARERV
jgi:hypothetical protein